jgi:ribosome-binding protein aMBF1 (putative translation factor)
MPTRSQYTRRFIAAIAQARRTSGLSQRELSVRLLQHPSFISRIERMERMLGVEEFVEIARAMNVEPMELFGEAIAQGGQRRSASPARKRRTRRAVIS